MTSIKFSTTSTHWRQPEGPLLATLQDHFGRLRIFTHSWHHAQLGQELSHCPPPRRPPHNNADCVWEEQHDHAIQELNHQEKPRC